MPGTKNKTLRTRKLILALSNRWKPSALIWKFIKNNEYGAFKRKLITDNTGKVLKYGDLQGGQNQIATQNLPKGIYQIILQTLKPITLNTIRLLLLGSLVLSISSFNAFSQDTIQALSYYKILGANSPNTLDKIDSIKNISVQGDSTTFELHTYFRKKFESKSSFTAKNKQVIRHEIPGWKESSRHVVFDFTLQKDDTFNYNNGIDTFTLLVDSVRFISCADSILRKAIYLTAAYFEDRFGTVVWIEGLGTLREGFDWVLRRIVDGGYTNVLSICNEGSLVYWTGKPEDFDRSCDFNYLDTYLGIEDRANKNKDVAFFPNPCWGSLSFAKNLIGYEYKIVDLNGRVRSSGTIQNEINIHSVKPGFYILQIQNDEEHYNYSLIVR